MSKIEEIEQFVRQQKSARVKAARVENLRHDALDKLGHVAVCLKGYKERVPVAIGSNATAWPIQIIVTKDPVSYPKKPDLEQPIHEVGILRYVWTESDRHAKRLKERLEALLFGEEERCENYELRHAWINIDDPYVAWEMLLADALAEIRKKERFVVFDEAEHIRRVQREMAQGMKGVRRQ